jgi:ATP-dependent DNA ligase
MKACPPHRSSSCSRPRSHGLSTERAECTKRVDGYGMLAFKDGDRVRLVSRQGKDHTRRFPGLVEALRTLRARSLVLDGEVARYDAGSSVASSGCAPTPRTN